MRRLAISLSIAALLALGTVAAVSAADPTPTPAPPATPAPLVNGPATGTISGILGFSQAEIQQLRLQGQTLAQIAEAKGIDPQRLVDALSAQWGSRIDAREAAGALTSDEAVALRENVSVQAKAMVNQATAGGMRGSAIGAGPGATGGRGAMNGQGMGRNGAANGGMGGGMGRHGSGAGTGTCPLNATPAPQS